MAYEGILNEMFSSTSGTSNKFKVRVLTVDHNETIQDNQIDHRLKGQSKENNRGFRISGIKLEGNKAQTMVDIIVPVNNLGEFMIPQRGDVVVVEYSARAHLGDKAVKVYSEYDNDAPENGGNPVPLWGSQPGDYGFLHSFKYHNMMFSSKAKEHKLENIPTPSKIDFRSKWVVPITGTRFRRFYKSSLRDGKFVLRSDPVFDVDKQHMNQEIVIEDGVDHIKGQGILKDISKYPNPLNVPKKRQKDETAIYRYSKYRYLANPINSDPYKKEEQPVETLKSQDFTLRTKFFNAYEPLMDKSYRERTRGFERELHAVDEWQTALKGNNKILMQDQNGDGEQLLMLFKNALDAGLAIVQNGDTGHVRLRDNMGQNIFFEGDENNPRIVLVTANRQKFEMGYIKGKGSYVLIRNGQVWGDSDASWGTKTGKSLDSVANQEMLFADSEEVLTDPGLLASLSGGMAGLVGGKGAGLYYRSGDGEGKYEQTQAMYHQSGSLKREEKQVWLPKSSMMVSKYEVNNSGEEVKYSLESTLKGKPLHNIKSDNTSILYEKFIKETGKKVGFIELNPEGATIDVEPDFSINVGKKAKSIQIGGAKTQVEVNALSTLIKSKTVDIIKG